MTKKNYFIFLICLSFTWFDMHSLNSQRRYKVFLLETCWLVRCSPIAANLLVGLVRCSPIDSGWKQKRTDTRYNPDKIHLVESKVFAISIFKVNFWKCCFHTINSCVICWIPYYISFFFFFFFWERASGLLYYIS